MSDVLKSFLRHERELKRYLSRFFASQQDVDDIAQDAFIKAFATELRGEVRSPRKLLFRAAKHAAINALRKKANLTTDYIEDLEASPVVFDNGEANAEETLDSRRKLAAFSKAVASLPPACREVYILRKFEGLSNKDIARRLKISVSAVEKQIATGTVKCSRYLMSIGYEPAEFGGREAHSAASARAVANARQGEKGNRDE